MSKEVSQYFDGFFLQEAIDRNKPKDYKSITASYFDRVSRELEKLLNGFKSLEDLNNLSEYTEKIVKYFTYEKYNLPEIITEDFDQKLEKEMSSNIRGEYFDKYVAHQKLYNFLYHLDNLRSETENKKWQFVLANQKTHRKYTLKLLIIKYLSNKKLQKS